MEDKLMGQRMAIVAGLVATWLLGGACPALPCSLCGSAKRQDTLRQDLEQAKIVLYGTIANPRFSPQGAAGSGVTEFHIARAIKDDSLLGNQKTIELPWYVPVLDAKDPPRFVVFFDLVNGKISPFRGRPVLSPAVLDYLEGMKSLRGRERTQVLLYFFRFLDHDDAGIAADAFLEFARSTDQEIGAVAKYLPAVQLRKLLQNPRTPPERVGLYAFLLGACGGDQDADFLKKLIEQPSDRIVSALDGILGGYIHLRPRQGWDLAVTLLADSRRPFEARYAVSRTIQFYQAWKPVESHRDILRALRVMIDTGDLADMAIEDLRRWQTWDLTANILAHYGKPSHSAPIVRSAILRYALSCPQPEARQFLDAVRRQDGALLRDLEERLELDR
jgi:hypothetical protein